MSEDARVIGLMITMFGTLFLTLFVVVWIKDGLRESVRSVGSVFLLIAGIFAAITGLAWAWGIL